MKFSTLTAFFILGLLSSGTLLGQADAANSAELKPLVNFINTMDYIGTYGDNKRYSINMKNDRLYYTNPDLNVDFLMEPNGEDYFVLFIPSYLNDRKEDKVIPDLLFNRDSSGQIVSINFVKGESVLGYARKN